MSKRDSAFIKRLLVREDYITPQKYESRRVKKPKPQYDYSDATEKEIQMCLNCTKEKCNGYCEYFTRGRDNVKRNKRR